LQRPDAGEPPRCGRGIESAKLPGKCRDTPAVTVRFFPGVPANLCAGWMKMPKAKGLMPTGIVAVTEFVTVSPPMETTTHMLGVPPKSSGGATNRRVMSRLTKCLAPAPFSAQSARLTSASGRVVTAIGITRICPGGIGSTPRIEQSFPSGPAIGQADQRDDREHLAGRDNLREPAGLCVGQRSRIRPGRGFRRRIWQQQPLPKVQPSRIEPASDCKSR
jgi:hypothetical protein